MGSVFGENFGGGDVGNADPVHEVSYGGNDYTIWQVVVDEAWDGTNYYQWAVGGRKYNTLQEAKDALNLVTIGNFTQYQNVDYSNLSKLPLDQQHDYLVGHEIYKAGGLGAFTNKDITNMKAKFADFGDFSQIGDVEKKQIIEDTYDLTTKQSETNLAKQLTDIQEKAGEVAAPISTSMGAGMRTQIKGREAIGKDVQAGYDAYGLAQQRAETSLAASMETYETETESDLETILGGLNIRDYD